jgi:hypothetical protein
MPAAPQRSASVIEGPNKQIRGRKSRDPRLEGAGRNFLEGSVRATGTAAVVRSSGDQQAATSWGEIDFRFIDIQRAVAIASDDICRKRALLDGADGFFRFIRSGEIRFELAIDGLLEIGRANNLLTPCIEAEIADRLRGYFSPATREAIRDYHANGEPERTDVPKSLSDEEAWATFDRRERARPSLTEYQKFLRRLLEPHVSLDRSFWGIQRDTARLKGTPQTTIEAIMVAARERGLAALDEPTTQGRMARCDADAQRGTIERIARLERGANAT